MDFLYQTDGFLGALPDGLVVDPSSENPSGLVEANNIQLQSHGCFKMKGNI